MSGFALDPYAVQQHWRLPEPLAGHEWQVMLETYLANLARACVADDAGNGETAVIGHIKLLALFSNGGYLRISAVSARHPPTSDGHEVPDGLTALSLTLNVLVFGRTREALQHLARVLASDLAIGHGGRVTEETGDVTHVDPAHPTGNHPHPHAG